MQTSRAEQRVLVTGCDGYLGGVASVLLAARDHQVSGLDTGYFNSGRFDCVKRFSSNATCASAAASGALPALGVMRKDVRDVTVQDLSGFDTVVHLAALSGTTEERPRWTHQINLEGALHLAYVARQAGISRFLFSSSLSVYGEATEEKATEFSLLAPTTVDGETKAKTEEGLERLASYDFSPIYLRIASAYGVASNMRLDLPLNAMVASAFCSREITISGNQWMPLIHAQDIACAIASLLEAPREVIHNEAFNVGVESENYHAVELAELVSEYVPGSRIQKADAPKAASRRADFSKLCRLIPSFEASWTARRGVAELLSAMETAGLTSPELPQYSRCAQIEQLVEGHELDQTLRWRLPPAA